MTIGWAIVAVAILYLFDKYRLLKKSLLAAGIVAIVIVIGYYDFFGWLLLQEQWQNHYAKVHQCFDPSTGKIHPVNASEPWCADDEQIQPLVQIDPKSIRPLTNRPTPDSDGIYWDAPLPAPDGSEGVPNPNYIPPTPPPRGTQGDIFDQLAAEQTRKPIVWGSEFLFRRPGEKGYSKAICYDENTKKVSHSPKGSEGCRAGSILMEEVK